MNCQVFASPFDELIW